MTDGADDIYHVYPMNDLVGHDLEEDAGCVCGPTIDRMEAPDGRIGVLVVHHSLDGREQIELLEDGDWIDED